MKKYIILFFLFSAGASYSQPVIDSMLIDEMKGELYIYGTFGATQGKVTVDSVQMQVKSWTDSLITSSIPDTGRGSQGSVVVKNNSGLISNDRMITEFSAFYYSYYSERHSLTYERSSRIKFVCRLDLESILVNKSYGIRSFSPKKETSLYEHCINACTGYLSVDSYRWAQIDQTVYLQDTLNYLSGFQCDATFDPLSKVFDFYFRNIKGFIEYFNRTEPTFGDDTSVVYPFNDLEGGFSLNSFFQFKTYNFDTTYYPYGTPHEITSYGGSANFLPPKVIALQTKTTLLSPISGTLYSYKDAVKLLWDSLSLMTSYHFQVSSDSIFSNKFIDTTISSTTFALPPLVGLTKYFWRVAGINSEGESRWSDVWNFTTGATADVTNAPTSPFTFSAYPNPASDKLNISYSASQGEVAIALYDLLGNKVRSLIQKADGARTTELALRGLPTGMYVLELQSGSLHNSMPISILR